MNIALKMAITERYSRTAYKLARKMGISVSTLSHFISEIREPSFKEKKKLAKLLGKSTRELFGNGKSKE